MSYVLMDPCPFVRLTVANLALKLSVAARSSCSVVHPSSSPCYCVIKLKGFPRQNAIVPFISPEDDSFPDATTTSHAASFNLSKSDLEKFAGKNSLFSMSKRSPCLKISVYSGRSGVTCGLTSGGLLGIISVPLDLIAAETRAVVSHNGWISVGKETKFHLNVKAEPDPRFVFQFDDEPECSPQVFQIGGNIRQPVFTCKFSLPTVDVRNQRSRSCPAEYRSGSRSNWLSSFGSEREKAGKERKGWSITIHDLSGSSVAAASMVTPFVASPGSDRVSRSNPGCWLILRPEDGTWKPWGRLEAWRERGTKDGIVYRLELTPGSGITSSEIESTLSCRKGGKFVIDLNSSANAIISNNGDSNSSYGFVMSSSSKTSGPMVEVSVKHVNCSADAAVFVALSAALDLSLDACQLFGQKLRQELCQPQN